MGYFYSKENAEGIEARKTIISKQYGAGFRREKLRSPMRGTRWVSGR
jgi:Ni/Co efflux regulator RcnB